MLKDVARGVHSLVARGPRETADRVRHRLHERVRERRHGLRTAEDDPINGSPTEFQPYVAAPYACLDTAFAATGVEAGKDVFLDYGCGRGRVVAVAATLPFARVIGIELRPELVAAARENLLRVRGRRCGSAEVVEGDAAAYAVPDDVTVIFLFNPFTGGILRSAFDRIRESIDRRPRPVRVVYMNPLEDADPLAEIDWLERVCDLSPGRWHTQRFGLYVSR